MRPAAPERLSGQLEVPADACAGHFPGNPVVPGVLQLILVEQFLGARIGDDVAVSAVPRARFRRPVVPGDVLGISARSSGTGWTFSLTVAGEVVCDGSLARQPLPVLEPGRIETMSVLDGVPPAGSCLPHRQPMLLVDGLLERSASGGICRGVVGIDAPLARGSRVPGLAAVEVAAQALGYVEAATGDEPAAPLTGSLVGVSDLRLAAAAFPAAAPLRAEVRRTAWVPPLARAEARVSCGGHEILHCSLSTWVDTESFHRARC
jgi:3-hydroxymyristoyl/3-hydroxydecanoyl-(acyl carrier protein) dehydratase